MSAALDPAPLDATDGFALGRFRTVQRLAYECVLAVEKELCEGMTEKEAALRMRSWLAARGVQEWFHHPFAWFGDRTAFPGFWTALHFFPTRRTLRAGDAVILDVAPAVGGFAADVGYSCCFGENPAHSRLLADLEPYRELILRGVRKEKTLREIYRDVDALIASQGHRSCHRRYPQQVLAHRLERIGTGRLAGRSLAGFGLPALRFLAGEMAAARRGAAHHSPIWNGHVASDFRPGPGLWAVEPHIGHDGVGAKWEEILVITGSDAYWLDDDLPHVRRWNAR